MDIYELIERKQEAENRIDLFINSLLTKPNISGDDIETIKFLYHDGYIQFRYIKEALGFSHHKTLDLLKKDAESICEGCGEIFIYKRNKTTQAPRLCDGCEVSQQKITEKEDSEYSKRWDMENEIRQANYKIRRKELDDMTYKEYLQTPEWKEIRTRAYRRAGFTCALCNNGGQLNCHHRNYTRRGHERPNDLIVLCEDCHQRHHGH